MVREPGAAGQGTAGPRWPEPGGPTWGSGVTGGGGRRGRKGARRRA